MSYFEQAVRESDVRDAVTDAVRGEVQKVWELARGRAPRETVQTTLGELLDTDGVAALLNVKATTVSRYRARDASFPEPIARFARDTTPVWYRGDLIAWQAGRPGRGGRWRNHRSTV